MKRKKQLLGKAAKVLATSAVCAALMAAPAFAADGAAAQPANQTTAAAALNVKSVTLQAAIDNALANSSDVIDASNGLEKAKLQLKQAQSRADDKYKLAGRPAYSQLDQDMYKLIVLAPQQLELAVKIAEKGEQAAIAAEKLSVISQYYTIASYGKTENAKLDSLEKTQRQYDVTNSKFKVGMASKLEVMTAQLQVDSARIALDAARNNTQQAKRTLCASMGVDSNTAISLGSALDYQKLELGDIDNAASALVAEAPTVAIDEYSYELARLQYETDSWEWAEGTYTQQIAEKTLDSAKAKYDNTKRTTLANAYKSLESLQLAERQYNTAVKSKELQAEVYRLAVLRYENGLATQNDVLDAAGDLTDADTTIIGALLQYNVAKTAYEQKLIVAQ